MDGEINDFKSSRLSVFALKISRAMESCLMPWRDLNFSSQPVLAENEDDPLSLLLRSNAFAQIIGPESGMPSHRFCKNRTLSRRSSVASFMVLLPSPLSNCVTNSSIWMEKKSNHDANYGWMAYLLFILFQFTDSRQANLMNLRQRGHWLPFS